MVKLRAGVCTDSISAQSASIPIGTFLEYGFMGEPLRWYIQEHFTWAKKRDITLQLGFEPSVPLLGKEKMPLGVFAAKNEPRLAQLSLAQLKDLLLDSMSLERKDFFAVRFRESLYAWVMLIKSHPHTVIIRPMSEMNETACRWQLRHSSNVRGAKPGPELFFECWTLLRAYFRLHKVENVKFAFCPLAHKGNKGPKKGAGAVDTLAALELIAPQDIDYLAINPYTTRFNDDNNFRALVEFWMSWMNQIRPGKPWIVGEMGIGRVDSETQDTIPEENRRTWITTAFAQAKQMGFEQVTFFNRDEKKYLLRDDKSEKVLAEAIAKFQAPA